MVFEGQVAKNTVIYSVFLTNVKKHWYLRCFHSHRNIKQCNLRGFWKFWSYHKTTKISPKTGPKTQKSASGPGHLRNRKKDVANQKIEVNKLKNTGFFHFSLADFGRARSRTGVFRTVFYSVFWRRASRPIKNRMFWPKNAPPPR